MAFRVLGILPPAFRDRPKRLDAFSPYRWQVSTTLPVTGIGYARASSVTIATTGRLKPRQYVAGRPKSLEWEGKKHTSHDMGYITKIRT
ncbi:hypothetical protein CDAR_228441 [Caerostris darwini]|uniref:Ribosomal protein L2 n=1 Tax=Caerostris darwini TaxID=1538125 RepID=A0AAV4N3J6_9ARAC|nr:hypothetical protein CDAR_228441 [Caerostris darwini]